MLHVRSYFNIILSALHLKLKFVLPESKTKPALNKKLSIDYNHSTIIYTRINYLYTDLAGCLFYKHNLL